MIQTTFSILTDETTKLPHWAFEKDVVSILPRLVPRRRSLGPSNDVGSSHDSTTITGAPHTLHVAPGFPAEACRAKGKIAGKLYPNDTLGEELCPPSSVAESETALERTVVRYDPLPSVEYLDHQLCFSIRIEPHDTLARAVQLPYRCLGMARDPKPIL